MSPLIFFFPWQKISSLFPNVTVFFSRNHLRRGDDSRLSGIMDIVKLMPRSLFEKVEWGLTDILAVQVSDFDQHLLLFTSNVLVFF